MSTVNEGDYWIYRAKGLYDGWRHVPFSTQYPELKTAVTKDVLEWGLIYAVVILAVSFVFVLPGFRKSERITTSIRIFVSLLVIATILLSNFGQEWEVSRLKTKTPYRAGLKGEINASIGVKIGLRSVNITLKTDPTVVKFEHGRVNETVDYNERLSWDNEGWTVGRLGFGPNAGRFNQEFREHQRKGSPYPILWIAEYFTFDGEGIRWGRHYLQAGYFTHIMLWTAFSCWILALVLFHMVLRYGGYASMVTGLCLIVGNVIYATYRNSNQLVIPFEHGFLEFHWGWSFWLCLVTGVFCFVIGILVVILDEFAGDKLADFFGIDFAQDLEEIYLAPDEFPAAARKSTAVPSLPHPDSPVQQSSSYNVEMMERSMSNPSAVPERAFRKKSVFGARMITPRARPPPPAVPTTQRKTTKDNDNDDYENNPTTSGH